MARRSPANERYQKNKGPAGSTRKSAAAAKPKRASGAAPAASSAKTVKSKGSSAEKKRNLLVIHPDTPEYKRWRRIWWVCLGGAMALVTVAFLVNRYLENVVLGNALLISGYASMFGALYIDWTKLRRIRADWVSSGQAAAAEKEAEKAKAFHAATDKAAEKAEAAAAAAREADDKAASAAAGTDKS